MTKLQVRLEAKSRFMKGSKLKKSLILIITVLSLALLVTGCAGQSFTDAELGVPEISVTSDSIVQGRLVTDVAADRSPNVPLGGNQSPHVSWEPVDGADYYAVIMFDESAGWLHFLVTDITVTEIEQGRYTDTTTYVGPYPPKSSGEHNYRIEVFAIREQPTDSIAKINSRSSYAGIVNHLNQVGGNSDNIIARGHITGTYQYGDDTGND